MNGYKRMTSLAIQEMYFCLYIYIYILGLKSALGLAKKKKKKKKKKGKSIGALNSVWEIIVS